MFCKLFLGFVLLGVASYAEEAVNDIPELCLTKSVTPVSCADLGPPELDDGLRAHPDECTLFYYCVEAARAPVCRQCPAGLHFNRQKHVCDQRDTAGCQ